MTTASLRLLEPMHDEIGGTDEILQGVLRLGEREVGALQDGGLVAGIAL